MTDLDTIQKKILSFRNEREWAQFHDPKNLAEALSIEAAELLENFLWKTTEQSRDLSPEELKNVKEELADIFIFLTYLSEEYKIDLLSEVEKKIALNATKYPVDKARGSSKKYTDLKDSSKSKGIYFIPAGTFTRNREKSLDSGFKLTVLKPYLDDNQFATLKKHFSDDDAIYIWGANEKSYSQLSQVQKGDYVLDVKNTEVVQVFEFCFNIKTNNHKLQNFIKWDDDKPIDERRHYEHIFFLKNPRSVKHKDKSRYQRAFAFEDNPQWLIGQRYFNNASIQLAMTSIGVNNIEDFIGI